MIKLIVNYGNPVWRIKMSKERILSPVKRIRSGISLPHLKNTAETETVIIKPERVFIPVVMHIGAPCKALVKAGDAVFVGTKIADSDAPVSAPIHSSVSGTVVSVSTIELYGRPTEVIEIESDGKMEKDPGLKPFPVKTKKARV